MSTWAQVKDIQYPDCMDKNVMMLSPLPFPHQYVNYTDTQNPVC